MGLFGFQDLLLCTLDDLNGTEYAAHDETDWTQYLEEVADPAEYGQRLGNLFACFPGFPGGFWSRTSLVAGLVQ